VAKVVLERLEDGCEWNVAFELRRATVQHDQPATHGLLAQHAQQARLADACLAAQDEQPPLAADDRAEHLRDGPELTRASDHVRP
jgi:hypothetical protein